VAAVEKIEEKRKPDDFFGHRNRGVKSHPFGKEIDNGQLTMDNCGVTCGDD